MPPAPRALNGPAPVHFGGFDLGTADSISVAYTNHPSGFTKDELASLTAANVTPWPGKLMITSTRPVESSPFRHLQ